MSLFEVVTSQSFKKVTTVIRKRIVALMSPIFRFFLNLGDLMIFAPFILSIMILAVLMAIIRSHADLLKEIKKIQNKLDDISKP